VGKVSINLTSGKIEKSQKIVGIDLGTTNSLIASVNESDRSPYCLTPNKQTVIPSLVHIKNENITCGLDAIPFLISDSENIVYSVKRLMGKSYKDVQEKGIQPSYQLVNKGDEQLVAIKIDDKNYSPVEISGFILEHLKVIGQKVLGEELTKAVITVPAYYNDTQRQATRDAGKLAGLDVLRIINEPTAASLAYGIGIQQDEPKKVAVYDLGGGTFDVSLLWIQNGIFEVVATHGNTLLGGDDFDREIVKYWLNTHQISKTQFEQESVLRLIAEKAKKILSCKNNFEEEVFLSNNEKVSLSINKVEFEKTIKNLVYETLDSCKKALSDAQWDISDIEEVVMVGGSTRVPIVLEKVSEFFTSAKINNHINPDEVVALGAAVEADILAGNRKDILLLDITPLSLGIETLGGLMDVIIPRNSKIPTNIKRQYTTSKDGQVNLKISVFQGEREMVSNNRKLGEFILEGIPAMPAGLPKIEVSFLINADGILRVEAKELRSNISQEITLKPQFGLKDSEIKEILKNSMTNAKEDINQRMIMEACVEAEQLIYSTEKFLKQHQELIMRSDYEKTLKLIQNIKNSVAQKNKQDIEKYSEELEQLMKPYTEEAMNKEISSALKGKGLK